MAKYKPQQYSADNGKYSRTRREDGKVEGIVKKAVDVPRNAKCPCGSGKKHKNCCIGKALYFKKEKRISRFVLFKIRIKNIFK